MDIVNAFTVDVEDYFQVSAFENDISRDQWDQFESRVVANTQRILDLLARHDVRATFFVLGWVARQYPELVREIHNAGHEIGSHSFWHRLIYNQTPEEFRSDLRQSRDILADIIGEPITAYRAPSFSITRRSLWALDILAQEGFQFDSSVFPIYHDRYGIPDAKPTIHQITTSAGPLWEFPPSVFRFARLNFPVGGGGYFRLYPLWCTVCCLKTVNRRTQQPFMFYVHPWEIDPGQPRIRAGSPVSRFRHTVNLSKSLRKLDKLLRAFRFQSLSAIVEHMSFGANHDVTGMDHPRELPVR